VDSDGQILLLRKGGEKEDPEQDDKGKDDNEFVKKPESQMSTHSEEIIKETSPNIEIPEEKKCSQVDNSEIKDKPKECLECVKKEVENDTQKNDIIRLQEENTELTEIIKQFDPFTTADQMTPDTLQSSNSEINNRNVPFRVKIPFEDLRKKMQEIFAIEGDNGYVTISGDTDIDTGKSTLQYYGSSRDQS
jgi:tRNA G10  N-methylase Trm11